VRELKTYVDEIYMHNFVMLNAHIKCHSVDRMRDETVKLKYCKNGIYC